jgi:signal transduction histidine kinase
MQSVVHASRDTVETKPGEGGGRSEGEDRSEERADGMGENTAESRDDGRGDGMGESTAERHDGRDDGRGEGRSESKIDRLKAHLLALSTSLPKLTERVRALAEARGDSALASSLGDGQQEGQRLASFAAYLEHYSRVEGHTRGPLDVRTILEQAVALSRGEIERKAQVTTTYRPAPLVRASSRQLGQVFVSLLINAAQALPEGARDTNRVGVALGTSEAGWARVVIADTGAGISAEALPRIFEPLYSTKRGAGMGIGLAIVREIIQGIGGQISVESEPGIGTLFLIELPPAP